VSECPWDQLGAESGRGLPQSKTPGVYRRVGEGGGLRELAAEKYAAQGDGSKRGRHHFAGRGCGLGLGVGGFGGFGRGHILGSHAAHAARDENLSLGIRLTRAALSTCGRAKSKFLSVFC
jgi:F0F1-type ATP synthase membrane subunit c/vacuolar-type H+-ATPase subunit K